MLYVSIVGLFVFAAVSMAIAVKEHRIRQENNRQLELAEKKAVRRRQFNQIVAYELTPMPAVKPAERKCSYIQVREENTILDRVSGKRLYQGFNASCYPANRNNTHKVCEVCV